MVSQIVFTSVLLLLHNSWILGNPMNDIPEKINRCLSSDKHKSAPTKNEDTLAGECKPWSKRSCCDNDQATTINSEDVYNLDLNLCQNMSRECKKFFKKETCFFECSPNLGLWMTEDLKGQEEYQRYFDVPLCKSDCDNWFDACSEELTCTENWYKNMNENKENGCKTGKNKCETIRSVFKTAKDFCEKVWSNSYKVMENDENCIKFTFDYKNNTNDYVTKKYYNEKNSASNIYSYLLYLPVAMLILQLF